MKNMRSTDITNPARRFTNRVEHYLKYRPRYPADIIPFLKETCLFTPFFAIADIGSGTGFLSELFLTNGNQVFAVEPNSAMRLAAESVLGSDRNFISIDGSAEASTLTKSSVDIVAAAQAFHWFDRDKTRAEFMRILKPGGWVVLIWNDRRIDSTPFLQAYENLLQKFGTDYLAVDHKKIDRQVIVEFFRNDQFESKRFDNEQVLDYAGLEGRVLSSSYIPASGEKNHTELLNALKALFSEAAKGGYVTIEYDTMVYVGRF